jgi:hypothetical protein
MCIGLTTLRGVPLVWVGGRSVITISLTLAFVYGMAVAVYQDGILDWTGWRALSKVRGGDCGCGDLFGGPLAISLTPWLLQVGSIAWLPLVMCFSIIVGLGEEDSMPHTRPCMEPPRLRGDGNRRASEP